MSVRTLWRLGCLAAFVAAAATTACGNVTSNGNAPPVTGGGDDASPDQGGMPPADGGSGEGSTVDGPHGDGAPSGDAPSGQDAPTTDAPTSDGGAGDGGTPDAAGGDATGTDATGSDGTGGGDGGMDATQMFDSSPPPPVLCTPGETWGSPVTVLTTGAADATIFGAVTPDELTIAWASSTGGAVTAWYADRASTGVAFGAPQALASSFGALSLDRVSLSGDGLRIVGTASGGSKFIAVKRAARTGAFDTDDSSEFAGIGTEGSLNTYATPLLSGDDAFFFYILPSSTDDHVINESFGGPPWTPGAYLPPMELERVGSQYRRPSGISADDRSLFYWDETNGSEWIAYSSTAGGPFDVFENLGAFTNAAPTATCSRIYYSVPAGAGAITIVYSDGTPPDG
ncbi:MAG TPA: hypothetical protein VF765_34290 [Polyangiaceae bacterium]